MVSPETIYLPLIGSFFYYGSHFGCRKFLNSYYGKELDYGAQYRVSTRAISLVNAFMAVVVSLRTMLVCPDILYDEDPVIRLFIKFGVSYFIYDLYVMYVGGRIKSTDGKDSLSDPGFVANVVEFCKREVTIVVHHLVLSVVGVPIIFVLRNGVGDFFLGCLFFAELSTPFLSLRAIFHEFKIYKGTLYLLNGLTFVAAFFIARVMCIPYLYWKFSSYKGITLSSVPRAIPFHCNVLSLLFMALQIHWFVVILKTLAKRLPSFTLYKYKMLTVKFKTLQNDNNCIKQN